MLSQETFHRIYNYDSPYSLAHGVFVTDSGYYFGAMEGLGNEADILLGKLDLQGNVDFTSKLITPGEFDGGFYAWSGLQQNYRENFVFGYINRIPGLGNYPKIVEMSSEGVVENQFLLDFFFDDSLNFSDNGKVLVHNSDSSYYGFFTYVDYTTDSNPSVGFDGEQAAMLFKLANNGDTLWTKKFFNPSPSFGRSFYIAQGMMFTQTNSLLLCVVEHKLNSLSQAEQDWSKIRYIEVDLDGNVLNTWIFQDTQYCYTGINILPLDDGTYIHTYQESELTGNPPNTDYFWHRPVLSHLDANFQQIWKVPLTESFGNVNTDWTPNNMISINDSIFAGAYTWATIDWDSYKSDFAVRLFNWNKNGNKLWHRDYHYFPVTDSVNPPSYTLKDFQRTPDGGYIVCGGLNNYDSLTAGTGGQYAYFLKTNCLGYLGNPIANFSYTVGDSNTVHFSNESAQAGSYTWIFGDGETLQVDSLGSITHVYCNNGSYEVTLVAEGCDDDRDTVSIIIPLNGTQNENCTLVGDGTLLTVYPNPILVGAHLSFYTGNIPQGNATFELHDDLGRLLFSSVVEKETTYFLPLNFTRGMYYASLLQGTQRIETEKIIVE